jgi:hypothetical protein
VITGRNEYEQNLNVHYDKCEHKNAIKCNYKISYCTIIQQISL